MSTTTGLPMRDVVAALLVAGALVGCGTVTGAAVPECEAAWQDLEPSIVTQSDEQPIPVAVDCISEIDDERIRIGFTSPPGPSCHRLSDLRIAESADAVAVSVTVVAVDDPLAGACPDEPTRMMTEADLQAPVGDRMLLDGGG